MNMESRKFNKLGFYNTFRPAMGVVRKRARQRLKEIPACSKINLFEFKFKSETDDVNVEGNKNWPRETPEVSFRT
jgi:hypothetical protein